MTASLTMASALSHAVVFGDPQFNTDGEILALRYTPDGALLSIEEQGVLRRWNPKSGRQLEWFSLSDLENAWAFSRDGKLLASAGDDLTIWDVSSGQALTVVSQNSWVTALDFGRDSTFVAMGDDDGGISYWDAAGHRCVYKFRRQDSAITAVSISHDGLMLAAVGENRTITLWDLTNGRLLGEMPGHTDRIPALAWHPSGKFLVSAGWDATARIWDIRDLEPVLLLNVHAAQVTALAFSANGKYLVSADSAQELRIWDFAAKKIISQFKGPQGEIRCLELFNEGESLAAGGERSVQIFEVVSGKALAGSGPRSVARTFFAINKDGTRLASNGGGLTPRLWAVPSRRPTRLMGPEPVHALAFSPDGTLLAGASACQVRIWDASGKNYRDFSGPEEPVTRLAFAPDGQLLAAASSTGLGVWIWSVADGEPVLLIPDALDGCTVETLAFHPQGRILVAGGIDWLATGGSNGAISFWDLEDRCEIGTIPDGTTSIAFRPDGLFLASASLDRTICIWDSRDFTLHSEFGSHDSAVTCVAYSPDGTMLVSGSEDRTVRLWTNAGEELAVHELDSQVHSVAFSGDGLHVYCGNANTTCYGFKLVDLLDRP